MKIKTTEQQIIEVTNNEKDVSANNLQFYLLMNVPLLLTTK